MPAPACANAVPFSATDVDTELGGAYRGPGAKQTACSAADLNQFEANFQNPGLMTWADLRGGVGAACQACIFSTTAETRWGVVVTFAGDPNAGFINFGACLAQAQAADACGRAYQYDQFCANATCGDCSGGEEQSCIGWSWGGGGNCAAQHASVSTSCPSLAQAQATCGTTAVQHARVICGQ
jgi:hypothetical protein